MRYVMLNLGPHKLAYKGRRYWPVELNVARVASYLRHMTRADTEYVIFDRLHNCPVAQVNRLPNGGFEVTSALPFPSSGYAVTLQDRDAADPAAGTASPTP